MEREMKYFKVTVKSANASISYEVLRTEKGALSFGKSVEILVEAA
jgi:hypothetical protein